ncbi:MAG: hypothetical protein MI749_10330 [Desulfovibrionales bacterium]|nr:hypothetical protein [Desulfovibrionales bacterium]
MYPTKGDILRFKAAVLRARQRYGQRQHDTSVERAVVDPAQTLGAQQMHGAVEDV